MDVRLVRLGRSLNCRDVGGYPTRDGRRVQSGLLYRSDVPLFDEELPEQLRRLGLRTVIDLREPEERQTRKSALEDRGLRVVERTFGLGNLVAEDPSRASSLSALYEAAIRHLGRPIAGVITELCAPRGLPALVHCSAGKDRTGMIIGLVLSALGVDDADVARDYAVSAENLNHEFFRDLNSHNARVDLTSLEHSDADEMMRLLALVREFAGDARTYLTMHGVAPQDIDRLAKVLLTAAP